ncbi:RtcB family protein [Natranaerobius trueperi]|uniref:3'-phosphate/5'-hydroxy nucleic acid ligase n=1 Tax=Natranaerobius trueperi TaxID=759412 RepID=A0A226C2B1_9FIRM|nr:RtcB family protein [Natranaerobius trueperi]OWZ84520.1 RNA-splicing ligase RtcB [Natranaerobius trueperi]
MLKRFYHNNTPILSWADDIEEGAMKQATNLAELPFIYSHIALMADTHQGFGMPIGGVMATEDVVIPNAVGVDIGCGLIAAKTDIKEINKKQLKRIIDESYKVIPTGFKHHKKPQKWSGFNNPPDIKIIKKELKSAKHQIGSLGGGNHFCSIEKGDEGYIWIMVHSGSRNLGFKVADYYNKEADRINAKEGYVPKEYNLSPLLLSSDVGEEYFEAMKYCLDFSRGNRERIFTLFYSIFSKVTGAKDLLNKIDIHHNYASKESHFGKEVIVHRKGATRVRKGELGVVPGSMGTPSYIVKGLGHPDSFMSCSHGAGRVISRKKANKQFTKKEANLAMGDIVFKDWGNDLSEAPMAYKDIERVIKNQKDLITPIVKLTPLAVMKG